MERLQKIEDSLEMSASEKKRFMLLLSRSMESAYEKEVDYSKVQAPAVVDYNNLDPAPALEDIEARLLGKQVAVVKLTGGHGKKMGCIVPKLLNQLVEETHCLDPSKTNYLSILDIAVRQIDYLNGQMGLDVPLLLMTSFKNDKIVREAVGTYEPELRTIRTFCQDKYPRLDAGDYSPLPSNMENGWYASGHGNVYEALLSSGSLQKLLSEGKKYVLITNVDNLGGTVDLKILKHVIDTGREFCIEVTPRTAADTNVLGGSVVSYERSLRLLESIQMPPRQADTFKTSDFFGYLNTNNIWVNLEAIKRLFEEKAPPVDIHKLKTVKGKAVLELKTLAGSAIKSDMYTLNEDGFFIRNSARGDRPDPIINMGDLKEIAQYKSHFGFADATKAGEFQIPEIIELDSLEIIGAPFVGRDVTLKGNVVIKENILNKSTVENEVVKNVDESAPLKVQN